ncbi:hypothetical protein EVJ58_g10557 [Rhodofomes roseus]|uniref:Uncharacterized protein n=1 Tax=Rhodofomes roseus TaxID=34475 RepID=A0A4Y9XQI0_9APHY|nr:hypothetical protein EVJ58_g10557 [Rhodofomes roseus]
MMIAGPLLYRLLTEWHKNTHWQHDNARQPCSAPSSYPSPPPPQPADEDTGPACHVLDLRTNTCTEVHKLQPLPTLRLTDNVASAVIIDVADYPTRDSRQNRTWIVAERPPRPLGVGTLIKLQTSEELSGLGRIAAVNGICRYWISFAISGSTERCSLRAPIPWTALGPTERRVLTYLYHVLQPLPPPHPHFADNATLMLSTRTPYEFVAITNGDGMEVDLMQANIRRSS